MVRLTGLAAVVTLSACAADAQVVSRRDPAAVETSATSQTSLQPSATTDGPVGLASGTSTAPTSGLQLTCGGVRLPDDNTDLSALAPMGDDGERAWQDAAGQLGFNMRGNADWRILRRTPTGMQLIAAAEFGGQLTGTHFTIASFTATGDTWKPDALDNCVARWGVVGMLNVEWVVVDPSSRADPNSSQLHLLASNELSPCPVDGALVAPVELSTAVEETEDKVTVVVLTKLPEKAVSYCPTDAQPIVIELKQPLGTRTVLDSSFEPPLPLTLFRPGQKLYVTFADDAVLGWWDADAKVWVDSDATSPELPVAPGTEFSVVGLDGARPSIHAGAIGRDCEPAETWTVALNPAPERTQQTIAVNGDWPLLPRPVTNLSESSADYEGAVREYLAGRGLDNVPVSIHQVLRADIDADGTEETLITAVHPQPLQGLGAPAGFFSVVLLQRRVGSGMETLALFEDLHPQADDTFPSWEIDRVQAIGDLNGDGVMEVALAWNYYEGGGTNILDMASGSPQKVLSTSCGS